MYEKFSEPLSNRRIYHRRVFKAGRFALMIFTVSITIGIFGYHFIGEMSWVDAFLNSSMILGGMGQVTELQTNPAKIFAGFYALFSGVTFLSSMAIFLSPVLHRVIHKYNLDEAGG